jgi:DNA-binding SARP family transcriptional activator/tetratricopeptide (TPR) repeat protein
MSRIQVKVLGAWEVMSGSAVVPVPSGHLRSLLASLVLAPGRPVRIDVLTDQVWGEQHPVNIRATLSTYVTRLRRLLGNDVILSHRGGSYSLAVAADDVDLHRFRQLLRQARTADSADHELELVNQALGLWRGRPFTGVESDWLERDVLPALTEEWFTATERRIDLDLARDPSGDLIAELWQLTTTYSWRESLWVRLISALHRSGRRTDALDAYTRIRTTLRDHLGVDPGDALQRLHLEVLRDEPPAETPGTSAPAASGPHQLPPDNARFVGRHDDLAALDALLPAVGDSAGEPTVVVTIDGAPGTGKTTLAVHWAHQVVHRYPDVQLYLNLRGYSPGEPVAPAVALESVLRSLGVPVEWIPVELDERSALLRSTLAGRRTLILLDDARDATQVRALLPGSDSLVIVTSRNQLRALSVKDGAHRLTLPRLSRAEAVELLSAAAGPERVTAEPDAAARLVDLCDRLPLALAIIAERAQRADSLCEIVTALSDGTTSLADFGTGADIDLTAALSWSYRTLDPQAAAMFRLLGLHPANDIGVEAAAALADLPVPMAKQVLDQLVEAHMVERTHHDRYEQHDLIRSYAAQEANRTESAVDIEAALGRVLNWYLHAAVSAEEVLHTVRRRDFVSPYTPAVPPPAFASHEQANAWFEREFECLRSIVHWGTTPHWGARTWRIAIAMTTFLDRRIAWREGAEILRAACRAAQAAGDHAGEGYTYNSLACLQIDTNELSNARENLERAIDCFIDLSHQFGEVMALTNLGIVLTRLGKPELGLRVSEKARELATELRYPRGVGNNLENMGVAYSTMNEHDRAIDCLHEAAVIFTEYGDPHTQAFNLRELGQAYAAANMNTRAIGAYRKAIRAFERLGNDRWHAVLLYELGHVLDRTGHPGLARACWRPASVIMREFGDTRAEQLEELLTEHRT